MKEVACFARPGIPAPNLVQEQRGIGGANAQMSDESQKLYERLGRGTVPPVANAACNCSISNCDGL